MARRGQNLAALAALLGAGALMSRDKTDLGVGEVTDEDREAFKKTYPMKKGGTASSRADGCCQRGKTRGKFL